MKIKINLAEIYTKLRMFHIFFHSFAGDQEPDSKKRRYRRKEEEDEGQIVEYDDGKSKICIKYRSN